MADLAAAVELGRAPGNGTRPGAACSRCGTTWARTATPCTAAASPFWRTSRTTSVTNSSGTNGPWPPRRTSPTIAQEHRRPRRTRVPALAAAEPVRRSPAPGRSGARAGHFAPPRAALDELPDDDYGRLIRSGRRPRARGSPPVDGTLARGTLTGPAPSRREPSAVDSTLAATRMTEPLTMNRLIHGAVRRDLDRLSAALDSFPDGDVAHARELDRAFVNLRREATRHHEGEDTHIRPMLALQGSTGLLHDMESEHHAMAEALSETGAAMTALATSGSGAATARASVVGRGPSWNGISPTRRTSSSPSSTVPRDAGVEGGGEEAQPAASERGRTVLRLAHRRHERDHRVYLRSLVPAPVVTVLAKVFGRRYTGTSRRCGDNTLVLRTTPRSVPSPWAAAAESRLRGTLRAPLGRTCHGRLT